jgi:hypothetical protein
LKDSKAKKSYYLMTDGARFIEPETASEIKRNTTKALLQSELEPTEWRFPYAYAPNGKDFFTKCCL